MVVENGFERSEVLRMLQDNEYCKITFYKVNGDLRDMVCTLNLDEMQRMVLSDPDVASAMKHGVAHRPIDDDKDRDPNQVPVFDVEAKGWRSFLLTNLVTIEAVNQ